MTTSLCNAGGLQGLLDSVRGSSANARRQAGDMAGVAREARSVAVTANAAAETLALRTRRAGFATAMRGAYLQGIRNRLFLKYAGIDYEYYNVHDLRYRDSLPV